MVLLILACARPLDPGSTAECTEWPMEPGQAPLFGSGPAEGEPEDWPLERFEELTVASGLVARTEVDRPLYGDFLVDEGLHLEAVLGRDTELVYEEPLLLWPLPLEGSWSAEASFHDATLEGVTTQGIDRWEGEVVDVVELELDGWRFTEVVVVEARLERELVVSRGPLVDEQIAWLSPCHGLLARERGGRGQRWVDDSP